MKLNYETIKLGSVGLLFASGLSLMAYHDYQPKTNYLASKEYVGSDLRTNALKEISFELANSKDPQEKIQLEKLLYEVTGYDETIFSDPKIYAATLTNYYMTNFKEQLIARETQLVHDAQVAQQLATARALADQQAAIAAAKAAAAEERRNRSSPHGIHGAGGGQY